MSNWLGYMWLVIAAMNLLLGLMEWVAKRPNPRVDLQYRLFITGLCFLLASHNFGWNL